MGAENSNSGPSTYANLTLLFSPSFINLVTLVTVPNPKPINHPIHKYLDTQTPVFLYSGPSPLSGGLETPDVQDLHMDLLHLRILGLTKREVGSLTSGERRSHLCSGLEGGNSPRGLDAQMGQQATVSRSHTGFSGFVYYLCSHQNICQHWSTHNNQDSSHRRGCRQPPHPSPWFVFPRY